MGALAALKIEQLWQQYYTSGISNVTAAALQIKIWQLVDQVVNNGTFLLISIDSDSAGVMSAMTQMDSFLTDHPDAAAANLVAVTGAGQDYVIQKVPDGGATALLLGLVLVGFGIGRPKSKVSNRV